MAWLRRIILILATALFCATTLATQPYWRSVTQPADSWRGARAREQRANDTVEDATLRALVGGAMGLGVGLLLSLEGLTFRRRGSQADAGIDRMGHPLSHTAAVVAGVAVIVLAGCGALLLSDANMVRSTNWWSAVALAAGVLAASAIGYFRPGHRLIYVPVLLAGLTTLGLCIGHLWWATRPQSPVQPAKAAIQSVLFFGLWLTWAARTLWHLRLARRTAEPS